MKKTKSSFISRALLPLAAILATGAASVPAPTVKQSAEPTTVNNQRNDNKQTPLQTSVKVQNQYTDERRLPMVKRNKRRGYVCGPMSRHKAKMKCKKYC